MVRDLQIRFVLSCSLSVAAVCMCSLSALAQDAGYVPLNNYPLTEAAASAPKNIPLKRVVTTGDDTPPPAPDNFAYVITASDKDTWIFQNQAGTEKEYVDALLECVKDMLDYLDVDAPAFRGTVEGKQTWDITGRGEVIVGPMLARPTTSTTVYNKYNVTNQPSTAGRNVYLNDPPQSVT